MVKFRHKVALLLAVVSTALAVGVASPAFAASPKTNAITPAYAGPTFTSSLVGGIWSGAPVTMHCWLDNVGHRWFYVDGAGYSPYTGLPIMVHGYVTAGYIVNQVTVGHC